MAIAGWDCVSAAEVGGSGYPIWAGRGYFLLVEPRVGFRGSDDHAMDGSRWGGRHGRGRVGIGLGMLH